MSNTLHPQLIKNKISELLKAPKLLVVDSLLNGAIKTNAGLYTFWWVGDRTELLRKMKENPYYLKGPHYSSKTIQEMIPVTFSEEWLKAATQTDGALCLYVGKSTNIRQRVNGHLKLSVNNIWKFNEKEE